jgi:hypothetical protein
MEALMVLSSYGNPPYMFKFTIDENEKCKYKGVEFEVDENSHTEIEGIKYYVDKDLKIIELLTEQDFHAFMEKYYPPQPDIWEKIGFTQKDLRDDLAEDEAFRLYDMVTEINERVTRFKREIYEIGRVLTEAKDMLGHGRFIKWHRANFDFSYPTANNFMNVYKHCIGYPELVQTIKPSVLYKIASSKFPKDLREFLFENHHRLDDISNEKINRICKLFKDGRIDLKSHEIQDLIKYKENSAKYCQFEQEVENCLEALEKFYLKVANLALKMPYWPTPTGANGRVMGLNASQARKIERLHENICKAVGSTMPEAFAIFNEGELEPKVFENWERPSNVKLDQIPESQIKTNPYWGKTINTIGLKFLRQSVKGQSPRREIMPKSLFEPPKRRGRGVKKPAANQ